MPYIVYACNMNTYDSSGSGQRLCSSSQSLHIPTRFFELIGGPYDGILCYRNEEGLFINGMVITRRVDGATLKGHLQMPLRLQVPHFGRPYNYQMCINRKKYIYGDNI